MLGKAKKEICGTQFIHIDLFTNILEITVVGEEQMWSVTGSRHLFDTFKAKSIIISQVAINWNNNYYKFIAQ